MIVDKNDCLLCLELELNLRVIAGLCISIFPSLILDKNFVLEISMQKMNVK